MNVLHFTDSARTAALHILDSPFGERLHQIATIEDQSGCLKITEREETWFGLSSGELVLFSLLQSMTFSRDDDFAVCDLSKIDDHEWDRVITALFILRGRIVTQAAP